jgi:hypothetical protein
MKDHTLDTSKRAEGAIVIDGHRYVRVGATRSVQRTVNKLRRDARRLEAEAIAAEEAEDYDRVDELQDEEADCIFSILGALLTSENGAEPVGAYLRQAWMEDRLQMDTHLYPLMNVLFAEMEAQSGRPPA